MISTRFIPFSLAQAICAEGVPSLDDGYAAALQGLMTVTTGEGMVHFEWDEDALNKRNPLFLERLLMDMRRTRKTQD